MVPKSNQIRPYTMRLALVVVISIIVVVAFNEITFSIQKDKNDRPPQTIQLVIPKGTAARVEAGQDLPSIPSEMVFVIGDVLEVKNEDTVNHQIGPIWVPPGATGRLVMERADKLAYTCSFQTSRYLNFDVREPTTLGTRLFALSFATPTMAVLLFLYSILAFPIRTSQKSTASQGG